MHSPGIISVELYNFMLNTEMARGDFASVISSRIRTLNVGEGYIYYRTSFVALFSKFDSKTCVHFAGSLSLSCT